MKRQKGFTLAELLVVMSIISLLSSVILSSLGSARVKARDGQRVQALAEMKKALALYYYDNGKYPTPLADGSYGPGDPSVAVNSTNTTCSGGKSWGCLQNNLNAAKKYISQLPLDPVNSTSDPLDETGTGHVYRYDVTTDGKMYSIMAKFEGKNPLMCSQDGGATSKYKILFNTNKYQVGQSVCINANYLTGGANPVALWGADYFYYLADS